MVCRSKTVSIFGEVQQQRPKRFYCLILDRSLRRSIWSQYSPIFFQLSKSCLRQLASVGFHFNRHQSIITFQCEWYMFISLIKIKLTVIGRFCRKFSECWLFLGIIVNIQVSWDGLVNFLNTTTSTTSFILSEAINL